MRACLVFIFLLAATFTLSVKSKPHGKHHGLHKSSHTTKEKDTITEEANNPQVLPTLITFEASSQEQEDEELSSEPNVNTKKENEEAAEEKEKSSAVLLSEEELVDLLKKEVEEEEEGEEELEDEEVEIGETVRMIEDEETEGEEKKLGDNLEAMEKLKGEEDARDDSVEDELQEKVEKISIKAEKPDGEIGDRREKVGLLEEPESSTESEIPADLDYAADSSILQPFEFESAKINPKADDTESISEKDVQDAKMKEASEKDLLGTGDDYDQDMQNTEAGDNEQKSEQDKDKEFLGKSKEMSKEDPESNVDSQELKSSTGLESGSRPSGGEEDKSKNDSGINSKGRTRKQKKNQRARKHSVQRDETHPAHEESQQESEGSSSENTVHKAKRRRAGKWGPLVGVNPVQIRASLDLYPDSRTPFGGGIHIPETPSDPCNNFRCKRGKTCKLDANGKPGCVCQVPSECPPSVNEFDRVCGTDNKTYDTSCELFATKCNLEGTKKGQRLHLDYTGPCKLIPLCVESELLQFPLRMRDWLKNVLLQLYEQDTASPGFLTPKQRFRVKKIFENERRLHAGDHSIELLTQDFEKNYNMYIYPVHWQFAQLDQHPSDRYLSHSELAPLRVPLVPMEHCTSLFFQECDADKDKQVSFKEWTSCFGIRNDDMDVNLLF
ncbi:SPARC-like protein 1 [Melanotaenia boesemani]|uniref:SPARC-like protein 1 n=1 Tax=Melanotaenia boesemani TaxID=1250792 RepID=UPI001C03C1BF|nr:SPARC-like protein 1 [Melanotaenia boesemani]